MFKRIALLAILAKDEMEQGITVLGKTVITRSAINL